MKKFNFDFKKYYYVIFAILIICLLPAIVLNILKLLKVGTLVSYYPALDISACIVMSAIIVIVFLMFLNSKFVAKPDVLVMRSGFYYSKFDYKNIVLLKQSAKDNILLMYFKNAKKPELIQFIQVNIKPQAFDDFVLTVKKYNNNILYELYNEEDNN